MAKRPGEILPPDPALIARLLDVIELEIVPKTRQGVDEGNKIFGAAMLRKGDLSTIFSATNNETANPLNHGEISCINGYYAMVNADESKRVAPPEVLFLSTHEPCTLCSSAISWCGFTNFYYLYSHEDSRDSFQIGHDLNILKQVFKHEPGGYARSNDYWTAYSIIDMIGVCAADDQARLRERVAAINSAYAAMSETYQTTKDLCKNIALK